MLIVLLQWSILLLCFMGIGLGVLRWPVRGEAAPPHPVHVVFVGYLTIAVFAALWQYALPVGSGAQWTIAAGACASLALRRRVFVAWAMHWWSAWRNLSTLSKVLWSVVLVIAWVKSASPSESPDDGFYRVPYIQWISSFRISPGIANLEDRFGFNSSAHLVSALSGAFGPMPHGFGVNGLLMAVFASLAIGGFDRTTKGVGKPSNVVAAFGLLFLFRNMLGSVSADVPNVLFGITVFVLALRKIEQGASDRADPALYLMLLYAVFLPTLKLSSLFILLAPLYFLWLTVRNKQRLAWGRMGIAVLLIGIPWLVRFPILTGYLVFPIHTIDLFDVDWKVHEALVRQQFHYVSGFAKVDALPAESEALSDQGLAWIGAWFRGQSLFNRGIAVCLALFLLAGAALLAARGRELLRHHRHLLVLVTILALNVSIWFVRYPAFRFGWAWVVAFIALGSYFTLHALGPRALRIGVMAVITASLGQGAMKTLIEARSLPARAIVHAHRAPVAPFRTVSMGGFDVHIPEQQYCTTVPPPCLPPLWEGRVVARGDRPEDGFRFVDRR